MKILILNSILYTPEKGKIPHVKSIKDTMIYGMCLGFLQQGHEVTLLAAADYQPIEHETCDFEIVFMPSTWPRVFRPDLLPFHSGLYRFLRKRSFDLILSSETFSMQSLMATLLCRRKVIIWQELASHNRMMKQLPSRIWYHVIARLFMRAATVVARSDKAQAFISSFMPRVSATVLDHGINTDKFQYAVQKEKQFVVVGQLIQRKQVDKILQVFAQFAATHPDYRLYLVGRGPEEPHLRKWVEERELDNHVIFAGFQDHLHLNKLVRQSQAMLIYTAQDLNMVSIPESIVSGTPIVTNDVPILAAKIARLQLGLVAPSWDASHLEEIVKHNEMYVSNCIACRDEMSHHAVAKSFVDLFQDHTN